MSDSVKMILKIVGIVLAVAGVVCFALSFVEKLPDLKQMVSRRPKEYDDYADVD
ncbi:MAG: hypothetical protein J6P31_06345 [Oscillospiraceae bacterium]|nr:hypothetical protein [Oscillospiraceae bacterium]